MSETLTEPQTVPEPDVATDDASLRLQLLDAIERQDQIVRESRARVLEAAEHLKEARADHKGALAELQRLAGARSGELPLFDVLHPEASDPFANAAGDEWPSVPLDEVLSEAKHAEALADHGLHTMGELAEFTRANNRLTDVDRIGPVAAERIEDDLLAFWKAQAQAKAEADGIEEVDL